MVALHTFVQYSECHANFYYTIMIFIFFSEDIRIAMAGGDFLARLTDMLQSHDSRQWDAVWIVEKIVPYGEIQGIFSHT